MDDGVGARFAPVGSDAIDPLKQIDSVLVGFPENAREHGQMALVLRAERLDQARLVSYVRDQLQKAGDPGERRMLSRRIGSCPRAGSQMVGVACVCEPRTPFARYQSPR